ncbi:CTP:molybdopterin cytidylyltransferase MocA [Loktanella sp. DSM 29012]|uniref:nucleotidyltransferase family protein n=1 Tax=Loktanella sp. DSM 29012 TaxID=1881056 RepID=UPI0008D3CB63|nr:nucleotidyltransferase family protein [Loktanella sp. DSM 29012]SEQ24282.1 CTP:molybdopterin cytidylyltransferase MocA [Loktanella sp. DSM 29012]
MTNRDKIENIPIVVLAAGAASRMHGTDKLTALIDGEPLLRIVVGRAACVGPVHVALHHNAQARRATLDGLAVTVLQTPNAADGLSGTMRDAIAQLPACPAFMIILADMPDITDADMQSLIDARNTRSDALIWRGATADGRPGHPILCDASLRPRFAHLTGVSGGSEIMKTFTDQTVLVRFSDDRARLDLDTPEAWAAWRAAR